MVIYSDPTIRRLPVYFLIDCSSSMKGDAINAVDQGFKILLMKLSSDPHTSEIVWISIIVFNSVPRQMIPLCPLGNFKKLPLILGGSSNLGRALKFLNNQIINEVRKQTDEQNGDWKPLVFLLSDGKLTDNIDTVNLEYFKKINLIACGVGVDVNLKNLKKITDKVVLMKDLTMNSFNQLIDLIGSTMMIASQRTSYDTDRIDLKQSTYSKIVFS